MLREQATSNKRVISLLPQCEALRTCRSGSLIATTAFLEKGNVGSRGQRGVKGSTLYR